MISAAATDLLHGLNYKLSTPVAPSFFMRKLGGSVMGLATIRAALAISLFGVWLIRVIPSSESLVLFPSPASSRLPDSYSLSLIFYLSLLVIQAIQQVQDPTHMRSLGSITHLVIWCLHTFTMTILIASTISYYFIIPSTKGVLSMDIIIGVVSIFCEAFVSSWTVHWILLVLDLIWAFAFAMIVLGLKLILNQFGLWTDFNVFTPTCLGTLLVFTSFLIVWVAESVRDFMQSLFEVTDDEEDIIDGIDSIRAELCDEEEGLKSTVELSHEKVHLLEGYMA
ncbi:hypothetical protein HDU76_005548 [Blyttiomyces sp. JEL0837]|nr:hypothetical protein HDU76_005548 [Blyttiomyces sp. JEL0837]